MTIADKMFFYVIALRCGQAAEKPQNNI